MLQILRTESAVSPQAFEDGRRCAGGHRPGRPEQNGVPEEREASEKVVHRHSSTRIMFSDGKPHTAGGNYQSERNCRRQDAGGGHTRRQRIDELGVKAVTDRKADPAKAQYQQRTNLVQHRVRENPDGGEMRDGSQDHERQTRGYEV